jgi:hypothetical protein
MLSFFSRVDAAAHRQHVQQVADELKEHLPQHPLSPPPKRPVGRPKLKRSADEELTAAAAAEQFKEEQHKRAKYTHWFDSPYINDILFAHARSGGSARRTVLSLQQNAPDSRYEQLRHTTVAAWFDAKGKLKEQYQQQLDAGQASKRYSGSLPALANAEEAEKTICNILLQMRKAGTPLNSHIIRWVMLANVRSPCALPHLFGAIFCRCSSSFKGRLLDPFLQLLLIPLLLVSTSPTATTTGVRRRQCSAGSRMFCFLTPNG